MASFQIDFSNDAEKILKLVEWHQKSSIRQKILQNKSYYYKENWTIMHLPDRKYWSDRTAKDSAGNVIYDANGNPQKANYMVKNPYVSNNRVAYGIFADVVNQKVDTLLNETPNITIRNNAKLDDKFEKNLGYSLKSGAIEMSCAGYGFVFQNNDNELVCFNSEDCIPFYDDYTGVLRAFIRYIEVRGQMNDTTSKLFVEVYEEDGLTVYVKDKKTTLEIYRQKTAYKFTVEMSAIEKNIKVQEIGKLPIIEFDNNKEKTSDLTPSLRAKIDAIDLVQSGFVNNVEDFSDVFWVIKASGVGGDSDEYEEFLANINKTKRIFAEQATPEQFQIPHEARSKLVEIFKQQIVEESGIIDTKDLTSTQLTAVAIRASTLKLRQRISDCEWQLYKSVNAILELYQAYNGQQFEYEVKFNKLILENTTEMIDNLVKVQDYMSLDDKLKILEKCEMIDDAEETKKALEQESSYKLEEEEPAEITELVEEV